MSRIKDMTVEEYKAYIKARKREWYVKNRDFILARSRRRYREKVLVAEQEKYERIRAYRRAYYQEHREELKEYARQYYKKHKYDL